MGGLQDKEDDDKDNGQASFLCVIITCPCLGLRCSQVLEHS